MIVTRQVAQIPGVTITAEIDSLTSDPELDTTAKVVAVLTNNTTGGPVPYQVTRMPSEVLFTGDVPTGSNRFAIPNQKRPLWHGGMGVSL